MVANSTAEQPTVKIIDFGLARTQRETCRAADGTLRFMAPEALQGHASVASDVYSFGLLLIELFGQPVWYVSDDSVVLSILQ